MSRLAPLAIAFGALVLAGLIVGFQVVDRPGFVVPLALLSIPLVALTALLARAEADPQARRWLLGVLGLSAAARVLAGVLVHGVLDPVLFAPDHASYYAQGQAIARYWEGFSTVRPALLDEWQRGYAVLNGIGYRWLGDPTWIMVVLNAFAGLWTALLAYLIAKRCFGPATGRVAAVLTGLFPSMVLWSVLNIRDSLTTFVVTLLVFIGVRCFERPSVRDLVVLAVGALTLSTLRDYMGFLLIAGMILGIFVALRPQRMVSTLLLGTVLLLVGVFLLERSGVFTREFLVTPFEQTALMRRGLQQDFFRGVAGSAFGVGFEIQNASDALRYLPVGLAYFLFAPFPWAISSILQMATLPEVLLWYTLVPFLLVGAVATVREERRSAWILVGVLALTASSYAMVEGNFGTAYRHRAQIMPLFFVFCAHGIALLGQSIREERARRSARRSEARDLLLAAHRRES